MCPQKWKASACGARSAAPSRPAPLTASRSFPVRARKPRREVVVTTASLSTDRPGRCGEHALELEERVERSFREHVAVRRQHDRVRAAGDRQLAPGLAVILLVEDLELDLRVGGDQPQRWLERAAERAPGRAEDREQERRVAAEALDEAKPAAELGAFVVDRQCGLRRDREPQLAD